MRPAKSAQVNRAAPMAISDIPILAMLRERMQWHEARQQVLAENVANADTPNYQAKDLAAPTFDGALSASLSLARTDPGHIASSGGGVGGGSGFAAEEGGKYEVTPRGNSVTHEDEMMKV